MRTEDIPVLKGAAKAVLTDLQTKQPHSTLVMLNSLAEGGDQLCAEVALELGIPLIAVLPMPVPEYELDFQGEALQCFRYLMANAAEIRVAEDMESAMDITRNYHYRQAGIYLATQSHVLLACWDGNAPLPGGCGTAEVVDFMLNRSYSASCSLFRGMADGAVIQLMTPRAGDDSSVQAGSVRILENSPGVLRKNLQMTDEFNHDVQKVPDLPPADIIDHQTLTKAGPRVSRILDVFRAADTLSVSFRNRYLHTMLVLSFLGVLLVVSFLMYDEMEADVFLIVYGGILLLAGSVYFRSARGQYHRKYLEYRVLAEILRNQFYLSLTGIPDAVCDYLAWPHEQANAWIRQAVSAAVAGSEKETAMDPQQIRGYWIDGQYAYHKQALAKDRKKDGLNNRITRIMMGAALTIFLVVVVMESWYKPIMQMVIPVASPLRAILMMHVEQDLTVRGTFKIMLGLISSVTLFLANYYGKLSLGRKITDHEKMIARLHRAKVLLDTHGVPWETVYRELAKESIIENGEWLSYSRDQPPTVNI
jgi:hypothetical protein